MLRHFNPAHISAGLVAVLVGFTSSAAIIFQALQSLGAERAMVDSWFLVLGLGMGFSSIGLSLYYRQPLLTAWSTPGAAVMVTGLNGMSMEIAVGAFLFSSLLIVLTGVTGLFNALVKLIPRSIAAALLAGVLTPFAIQAMVGVSSNLLLCLIMLGVFIVCQKWLPRYAVLITLAAGIGVALQANPTLLTGIDLQVASPVLVIPEFNLGAIIGLGIPLFIVTMASQNLPGIAAIRTAGYDTPASPLISWTGITGLLTAPFGGFAFNLAAITAAICMTEDVDKDPRQRYRAVLWAGVFYVCVGLFATSITGLLFALPKELVWMIAGLALLGTIAGSLDQALHQPEERIAAMITFVTTASGVAIAGIGSAFWGLVFGLTLHLFMRQNR